jgi:hypothetical protein
MKTFLILLFALSVWVLPPYEEVMASVQVKTWSDGQTIGGSTVGTEAVFQLPPRMLKVVHLDNCIVLVNNVQVILDETGFVDSNPNAENPTFIDPKDRIVCKDGGSFVVRPYFLIEE